MLFRSWERPAGAHTAAAPGPTFTAAPAASATLPTGWVEQMDPSSNRPYYTYTATGHSVWERPAGAHTAAETGHSMCQWPHPSLAPSSQELSDFSAAASRLWQLDSTRLVFGRDIQINCGGLIPKGSSHAGKDFAAGPLFSFVSPQVWINPTFKSFFALLDNYEPSCGTAEVVTAVERGEEAAFLDACIQTAPMQYAHAWLCAKRLVSADVADFRLTLWKLWFKL